MRPICYIHGARATSHSFKFIHAHLPKHDGFFVEYNVDAGLEANIARIAAECRIKFGNVAFDIVAHSLGGVIALALSQSHEVPLRRVVTMSAPFGGSTIAGYLSWLYPGSRFYNDIRPNSPIIRTLNSHPVRHDVLAIVTTGGATHLINEPNDGVVGLSSQMQVRGPQYLKYDLNHFEVLLSNDVVGEIKDFLA